MRRNENFILRRVADMSVIVPLGAAAEAFPGMISVNETGAFLWDLLEQEQTLQSPWRRPYAPCIRSNGSRRRQTQPPFLTS